MKSIRRPLLARSRAVTIRDIAEHTGLSPTTVSLVLNGGASNAAISQATQAQVVAASQTLGYDLNRLRSRRRQITSVTILCPEEHSPNDPIHYHLVLTLARGLLQHGCEAILEPISSADTAQIKRRLRDNGSEAAIVLASLALLGDMGNWACPCVYIGDVPEGVDVCRVHVDNELGGRLAAEHLWSLGHRRVGVVQVSYGTCAEKRLEALRTVWMAAGGELPPEAIESVTAAEHELVAPAIHRLMQMEASPTALFCNSDWLASQVLWSLRELGLRVPEDVSVIGFDDAHYAQLLSPPLTTIRQPFAELGALAVELLLQQMGRGPQPQNHYVLPCALIVRESTASPRR